MPANLCAGKSILNERKYLGEKSFKYLLNGNDAMAKEMANDRKCCRNTMEYPHCIA